MDGLLACGEVMIQREYRTEKHIVHDPIDENPTQDHPEHNADDSLDKTPAQLLEMIEEGHLRTRFFRRRVCECIVGHYDWIALAGGI